MLQLNKVIMNKQHYTKWSLKGKQYLKFKLSWSSYSVISKKPTIYENRLMHLLDRSKFYANFLLQRMASKKEEEKLKVILCWLYIIVNLLMPCYTFSSKKSWPRRKLEKKSCFRKKMRLVMLPQIVLVLKRGTLERDL